MTDTRGSLTDQTATAVETSPMPADEVGVAAFPTESEPTAVATPSAEIESYKQITLEQLAAFKWMFSVERQATEYDIVITAALEALRDGPRPESELVTFAERIWPGAGINAGRMHSALCAARTPGYVEQVGPSRWALSTTGRADISGSKDWAQEIFTTTAHQVQEQLEAAGRTTSREEAQTWTTILQRALMAAIRGSFTPYNGDVVSNTPGVLTARRYNLERLDETINEAISDPDDVALLKTLAQKAIDPLTTFGSDLVTSITVGYMLHAFVGRQDRANARAVIGSLRGDRAILDTPILVQLLGAPEQSEPVERLISAARDAGMDVIVPDHYLVELTEWIRHVERDELPLLGAQLANQGLGSIGSLVQDTVVRIWLRGVERGRYVTWQDFLRSTQALPENLARMGIIVRPHGNEANDHVEDLANALYGEIDARRLDRRPRSLDATERDAHSMAMVHRTRNRAEHLRSFWPGAWIITTDTHMGPAYQRMNPADKFPLTLTPASWLAIVSNCSTPETAEKLATSASQLLSEEAFLTIAARFPVKTAIEIGQALGPANGGSSLDVGMAISIADTLRKQPDFDENNNAAGAQIAAALVAKRSGRLSASFAESTARRDVREARAAAALRETQHRAEVEETEHAHTKAQLTEVVAEAGEVRREKDRISREKDDRLKEKDDRLILNDRKWIVRFLTVPGCLILVPAILVGALWVAIAAVAAIVFLLKNTEDWKSSVGASKRSLFVALASDVIILGLTIAAFLH